MRDPFYQAALASALALATLPSVANASSCQVATSWHEGSNADEADQYIGEVQENGLALLEFSGPLADDDLERAPGYTTFAAHIGGLTVGSKYRLRLTILRETNGVNREVSLSTAGLSPDSRITFRYPRRQTLVRTFTANARDAVVMIHMKGYMKMWSFVGLPELCRI